MSPIRLVLVVVRLWMAAALCATTAVASVPPGPFAEPPDATIDLATAAGADLVQGRWRYADAEIVEVEHRAPGPDLRPSGPSNLTRDLVPHAGPAEFDDSKWEAIEPETLVARRSGGRLSFSWYRIRVTIPERVGDFDPTGSTVVFEIVVDDYAEVWVDGRLGPVLGQSGGPFVAGFNAPNRLVVGRDAKPGQTITIAVFAANGPLSEPPANFIWVRSATLDFYRPERARVGTAVATSIERLDPLLDAIVGKDATIERLATGFEFLEGPVWVRDGGYLLFSDPNANRIYRWTPDGQVSVFRTKSGYSGFDVGRLRQPGSNGLALDAEGRLTICEHGNRRITRIERTGAVTVLADRVGGKRLNSPNDLVYRSDGTLCFTDPPFGLPAFHDDPAREVDVTGVYCLANGHAKLVTSELRGPNGIVFSPDERFLYVANWDEKRKVVLRLEAKPDGTFGRGEVFFDMTPAPGEEALDGIEVDRDGNVYVSGPGGLWVISPEGKHLGTIRGPELAANFAWGDDGRTLYLTARSSLYRIRLGIPGAGW